MFSMNFKNVFKIKSAYLLRSTIRCESAKVSSETINKNLDQKDVETYRPLNEKEIQKIINLDNIHIVTKYQTKLPQRPPLIQNFFIGKVDNELLTYPQVMAVKDFNEMVEKFKPISNYFVNSACTPIDLQFRDVSNQMVNDFRGMKLFGSSVHQRFGGSGFFKSEMNLASESEANDVKSYLMLAGHRLAVEAVLDHGDFTHHSQYMMEMAKGEVIGVVCLHDPLNQNNPNRVIVSKTHDGDYVLNGKKSFVICSQHVNLLIVIAEKSDELKKEFLDETDDDDDNDDYFDSYLTIALDPNSSGITMFDESKTIGCNDVPFKTISFSNVRIGKSQILSETFDDRKISQKLLASARLQSATLNMIQAKNILNHLINFSISSEINSEKMRELNYVRENLAKIASDLYGLESMIYLTTGIIDQYDNPKVDLECAVAKAFSQDILRSITQLAMNLAHVPVTIAGHPIGLDIRNAIQLQCNETSVALKTYAGRIGLQHALEHFGRHASNYKDSFLSKIGMRLPTIEAVESKLFLGEYLHPTLMQLSQNLEESILRLQFSSEMLLNRYGDSVTERQVEIQSLGDAVMRNYAMFASIGRASRSYCCGLQYSVYETVAAASLIETFTRQILKMALDIKHNRSDYHHLHKSIVESVLKQHRNQSIPIPTVLQSGVIQKIVK